MRPSDGGRTSGNAARIALVMRYLLMRHAVIYYVHRSLYEIIDMGHTMEQQLDRNKLFHSPLSSRFTPHFLSVSESRDSFY
jgi:hypothetical protein